jgi:hypothetical protein
MALLADMVLPAIAIALLKELTDSLHALGLGPGADHDMFAYLASGDNQPVSSQSLFYSFTS